MSSHSIQHVRAFTACLFALSIATSAAADTITLKTAVRRRNDSPAIALGDIAVLEGEEALRLAATPVATIKSTGKPLEISVAEVRRALDAAGANWAKINLSGRSVIVRPAREANAAAPPTAMNAAAIVAHDTPVNAAARDALTVMLDAIAAEPSVRGTLADLLISNLHVDPSEMRLHFDADDTTLLETPLTAGRFEVQPLGSLAGDRIAFIVRAWNGSAIESKGQITLIAERRIDVTRSARDLNRSQTISESDLESTAMWLSPSEAQQVAPRAAIVGRSMTRSMKAGETIRSRDIERHAMIKRGDLCTVRCLVGGVAISLQAEAKADGSLGDAIEFRKSGERESFLATITAANEAVVNLGKK